MKYDKSDNFNNKHPEIKYDKNKKLYTIVQIKIRWKNLFLILIFILLVIFVILSIYKIVDWQIDNTKTNDKIEEINNNITIEEIEDSKDTEIIEQDHIEQSNPYWDYIKMNLIDVDFNNLKNTNNETIGWLQVNGTNINYPFVQAENNDYYLTHSFDKSYNEAGWVFLDYRNNIKELNKNTIIYAHGRTDQTMFGSLKNILTNGWLNDKNNFVIKMSTETENTFDECQDIIYSSFMQKSI